MPASSTPSLRDHVYRAYTSGLLLAGIVFPLLTVTAVRFLFGQMTRSDLGKDIAAFCPEVLSAEHRFRLAYTGLPTIDRTVCTLVAFFHVLLEPESTPLLMYFMATGAVTFVFPYVESRRAGRHLVLGWPLFVGYFAQTLTIGLTLTMYWLLFIWAGAARRQTAALSQADAEAIVFAVVVGMGVPTAGLLYMKDVGVTALWQVFPAMASLAVAAHLVIRPASRHPEPGYKTIRAMYLAIFMISSSSHIAMIYPLISDPAAFTAQYLPSLTALPVTSALRDRADNFLKWDAVYAFGTMALGSLWFAKDTSQLFKLLGWYAVTTPLVGPGAAVTGVLLWRESLLIEAEIHQKKD